MPVQCIIVKIYFCIKGAELAVLRYNEGVYLNQGRVLCHENSIKSVQKPGELGDHFPLQAQGSRNPSSVKALKSAEGVYPDFDDALGAFSRNLLDLRSPALRGH